MKCIILAIICLSAYGHAAFIGTENDPIGDVATGTVNLNLKAGSDLVTDDDRLLSQELESIGFSERNAVANLIADILEALRVVVVYGNDILPPLDPLEVPSLGPINLSLPAIRIAATLRNVNMQGLRWYVVDNVSFNALRLIVGVKVTVPAITVTGGYDANALITFIRHDASGNFRFFMNRLETDVEIRLGTNILGGGSLILRELNIDLKIHDVQIRIENMVGSNILNNMINSVVQNAAQNLLIDQLHYISAFLSETLFDAVNEVLGNFTIDDLLGNSLAKY